MNMTRREFVGAAIGAALPNIAGRGYAEVSADRAKIRELLKKFGPVVEISPDAN